MAKLKPRLRSHAKIHRQIFRGQVWYVLQDHASGRFHRFTPAAHLMISLMDGNRTVQEIWDLACGKLDEDILTQDEAIRLLSQLHQSDVLHGDVPPDITEASERAKKQKTRKLLMSFLNPLAVRLPLFDPEKFIAATYPIVRPLFSWIGAAFIFFVIAGGAVVATYQWAGLTENITDRVLATQSLLLLAITYPIVKALHELGHAYAVKHWGGEIHELGIMFLVFMPVPYVDASASAALHEKWRRAMVGAAGIIVELLLSAIALVFWINLEAGLLRAFAFNVILIGGVSTLFFNGNPLLRFDGYYVLSDLVEVPNLFQRANKYLFYLAQRYLYGLKDAKSPRTAPGERFWFVFYSISSFIYRVFITVVIVTFVATKFFFLGVLMAIWAVAMMYLVPTAKGVWFLMNNPALRRRRGRALSVTAGLITAIAIIALFLPLPYATVAEGVVWVPGDSVVHVQTDGVVSKLLVPPNQAVKRGQPLVEMTDPFIASRVKILKAEVRELTLRLRATSVEDRAEALMVLERLKHARSELALTKQREADLVIHSPVDGVFVLPRHQDLKGRFLKKGETVGFVTYPADPIVRVVVDQDDIELVREKTDDIRLRIASRFQEIYSAEIKREIPSVTNRLPSLVLSTVGGGGIALDPTDPEKGKALERIFQLELRVPQIGQAPLIGERVYIKFDHGHEAIATRLYRSIRQQFLKIFNV